MSNSVKTILSEIVLRFSTGMEHQQKKPGELEGAHLIELEAIVDDTTGAIIGHTRNPKNNQAQPLDPAKVKDLLGEQFATFAAQLEDTKASAAAEVESAHKSYAAQLAEIEAKGAAAVADLQKRVAEAQAAHEAEKGALVAANTDLAAKLAAANDHLGAIGQHLNAAGSLLSTS